MTESIDITIGTMCNNNCRFCVMGKGKLKYDSLEEIQNELILLKNPSIKKVTFLGGETTLHPKICEMVSFAKKCGYEEIEIISNGRMYYYLDFLNKFINAGVTRFSISIHAHNEILGDYLTRSPGSFKQTTTGIKNLINLNFQPITNTVINKLNYKYLPEIASFFNELGVKHMHLSIINPMGNAKTNFEIIVPKITKTLPYIEKTINFCNKNKIFISIDSLPLCLLPQYNKNKGEYCDNLTKKVSSSNIKLEKEKTRGIFVWSEFKKTILKTKDKKCLLCKYNLICEGVWKEYVSKFGFDEMNPIQI